MTAETLPLHTPEQIDPRAFREQLFGTITANSEMLTLAPGDSVAMPIEQTYEGSGTVNEAEQIEQDLCGVMRAGNELFGVVKVRATDTERSRVVLTRFPARKDERATIVGVLDKDNPLYVGRDGLDAAGYEDLDNDMSRRHFSVKLDEEGRLVLTDTDSTNGTEFLYPREPQAKHGGIEESRFLAGAARIFGIGKKPQTQPTSTWADEHTLWSAASKEAKRAIAMNEQQGDVSITKRDEPITVPNEPTTEIVATLQNSEFIIGNIRYAVEGYSEKGIVLTSRDASGKERRLLVYRSNSGGSYRVSQGLEPDGDSWRIMKGPEGSPDEQYTQDTQLHPAFTEAIAKMADIPELRSRTVSSPHHSAERATELIADFEQAVETYPLGGSNNLDALLHELPAGQLDKAHIQELGRFAPDAQELLMVKIRRLNEALVKADVVPDFTGEPIRRSLSNHPILGAVAQEVYQKTGPDGRVYEWHMARDGAGRAWIERLRFADAEPSVYGTDKQMVYSGLLTSKPLEYAKQCDGLPSNMVRDADVDKYKDITPFLDLLGPIKQYQRNAPRGTVL